MKVLVTGNGGQLALALAEIGPGHGLEVITAGRPNLDLTKSDTIESTIAHISPQIVINAAAYTAVDLAEGEPELAYAINGIGAGIVAQACSRYGIPIVQISTDYVFDGSLSRPYTEADVAAPQSIYGRSKREGERRVAGACREHIILRSAWIYSPFGHNFVKTMLRLAQTRSHIGVVDDQVGCPTYAPHLAEASLAVVSRLRGESRGLNPWGIYHAAGTGEVTWCAFAREIFRCSALLNGPVAEVTAITTADYPTPAKRPANSRLNSEKLEAVFRVRLPDWRAGTSECVARLLTRERLK